ncbi:unnamed protein product [Meloidogyne enterolobii]|uniref:Uncharacterized protein n=1 Tax=Meloidogyne enterolobii TaxID=390850 RepID=A0ACB0YNA0_MELEN
MGLNLKVNSDHIPLPPVFLTIFPVYSLPQLQESLQSQPQTFPNLNWKSLTFPHPILFLILRK